MKKPDGTIDLWKVGLVAFLLMWLSTLVLYLYLAFVQDNPALEFNGVELLTPEVEQNGQLVFMLDWCQYSRAPRVVKKTWRDGLVYTEPPAKPRASMEGCQVSRIVWNVPNGLPPGEYIIGAEVEVEVNFIAHRQYYFDVGPIVVNEVEE